MRGVLGLLTLAGTGAGLVALSLATARRPGETVPDLAGYYDRWRELHGGYDPRGNAWVRGWLALVYVAGRPLARRGVAPDVLTVWGLWLAVAVLVAAGAGGRWPLVGAAVVVASGAADTLDGCVAALTGRATRWGYVLDSVVDRLSDVVLLAALVALGAPGWLGVVAGVALWSLEYLRARAAGGGMSEVGIVTVGERGTRITFTALTLLGAGVASAWAGTIATGGTAAIAALCAGGFGQLALVARGRLR